MVQHSLASLFIHAKGGMSPMIRSSLILLLGGAFALTAAAQTQSGAQASAQTDTKASVRAGKTQAKARAKGESESALGIVFDKAVLKNGEEAGLNVAIEAMAAAQSGVAAGG